MTELLDRKTIERDVLVLLSEQKQDLLTPHEIAEALGYRKDERLYGRFRDVLDELEADGVIRREGRRFAHQPRRPQERQRQEERIRELRKEDEQRTSRSKQDRKKRGAPRGDGAAARPAQRERPAADAPAARIAPPDAEAQKAQAKKEKKARRTAEGDPNKVVGRLIVKPQGFGFVEVEGRDEDYFIRERGMGTALDGDLVLVGLGAMQKGHVNKRRECEVLEVVERTRTQVVGTLKEMGHFGFVKPDDLRVTQDVYVPQEDFGGARGGDKVVVSIDRYEDRKASPEGRVLRVIGPASDPRVRVLSLAMSMGVESDFPEAVEKEAERIPETISKKEIGRRLDLRDERIFTIDPDDAKDFDDAIHLKELPNGNYELGVHIADVSHYVEPGTALDEEAVRRATSVYLVDRTMPMLPEKLSNVVCSLRPEEDKCAFSCIMEVDRHGEVVGYEIRESVIHSKQRFTYEDAQDLIEGGYPDHPLAPDVVRAARLARTLTKKRMREGSVDFDLDEIKVIIDKNGHAADIVRKERKEANRMIEEFMLLANRTVSRHIGGKKKDAKPFPYRIHDKPDAERIQKLAEYVRVFGYELELTDEGNVRSTELNRMLRQVRGTPEAPVIERAALRAMAKAVYSTKNVGHYGLGFDFYSHFTSPIRRYPDLIAHRLLKRYATGGKKADAEALEKTLEHCSERERAAVEAERESVKLKQVEYAQEHVGETFDGVVTGVTKFGVFVELSKLLVEGLVHVRDMNDDYYEYDEATYTLSGERSGRTFRPGDTVRVQITGANEEKREIDLLLAD